jgi:hypothetical protein
MNIKDSMAVPIALALLISISMLAILISELVEPTHTNLLTEELLREPVELVISCTDTRGETHILACGVNSDVKGTWIIFEYVDGKLRGGTQSNFAFTEWEVRVGSDVSETIVLEFYPKGSTESIRTVYKMDTSYMRQGVRNFAGVVV